ncbi:heme-dependent oxidative N-demethylase family protein [Planktotalea arctica]|uniref:heme-dependent oxidative N-demethylase family protein n=1 Tax=Planktotalea arctica TaxID=1481893 RepID=UPI000A171EC1|nr:DUF3445 domain-containing protein [Planktotalea arctica]
MSLIFQNNLPDDMTQERTLPGVQPLDIADWLHVDDAYGAQMAERMRLMECRLDDVCAQCDDACEPVREALALIVKQLGTMNGFQRSGDHMLCPDGRRVSLIGDPLCVIGALIQEDVCILQKPVGAEEHSLSAAILCFPANWTLAEKFAHPMGRIHQPVDSYDSNMQLRVQRLCDGLQVGRPLWRFNHGHAGPELFAPRAERDFDEGEASAVRNFLRAERQSLIRLPQSGAILFSIHTYIVRQ